MPLQPLVGHSALRARFESQIARGALPASLLIQGPPGIGKQQLALWIARRLICPQPDAPCGTCQHCRYALDGVHPDIRWLFPQPRMKNGSDPALDDVRRDCAEAIAERVSAHGLYPRPDGSNGLYVYHTRLLAHEAVRTPAMAARKVFVIGDAERMVPQLANPEGANAFLKLLEEPPADTTLILTSSEPGALLPTIRSRVVSVRATPLTEEDVRALLSKPEVLEAAGGGPIDQLVRRARGAPGRLIGADLSEAAIKRARLLLDAVQGGREQFLRAAFTQGSTKSRGSFSDVLDAMTEELNDRARNALLAGQTSLAAAAAKSVPLVEEAKRAAERNLNPQLICANLLSSLQELGT